MNFEKYWEAEIERVWRCTWRLLQGFIIPIRNTIFIELCSTAYLIVSFLSSSYPKTQPLALLCKSAPDQTSSTVLLLGIGRSNFPVVQPLLGPLLEWYRASVQEPQHDVIDILEFAETKNVSVGAGYTSLCQLMEKFAE